MKSEKSVRKEIMLAVGGNGKTILLSNPTGSGYVGQPLGRLDNGKITLINARHMSFGLGVKVGGGAGSGGFPDLIGWTRKTITPDMVGQKVAIFTGIEVKAPGKKPRPIQQKRIDLIKYAGGLAGYADSVEMAEKIVK